MSLPSHFLYFFCNSCCWVLNRRHCISYSIVVDTVAMAMLFKIVFFFTFLFSSFGYYLRLCFSFENFLHLPFICTLYPLILSCMKVSLTASNANNIIIFQQMPSFLSDIGGLMGMWIGISVLTIVELLELIAVLFITVFKMYSKKANRVRDINDNSVEGR